MPMKRRLVLTALIVVMTLAPSVVMLVVTYVGTGEVQGAATWASIPAIVGISAVVSGGRRFAVITAIVMGFLGPLSIVAGSSPVSGAALMALLCMVVGRMARFGLHRSALLVPVMVAWPLIDPPTWAGATTVDRTETAYLLWMAVIFFVGAIIPALVVPLLMRKRKAPTLTEHPQGEAVVYTVMITVLVTVSTFVVLDSATFYGGAFLIATILVLAPIGRAHTLRPTVLRVAGTLLGSVFLVLVVSRVSSLALIYLIGLVFIVVALIARMGPRGWIYYVFMVPATACLNATTLTQVGQLGEQRIVDNVVGGALVLVATALTIGYSSWAGRRGLAEAADQEAATLERST